MRYNINKELQNRLISLGYYDDKGTYIKNYLFFDIAFIGISSHIKKKIIIRKIDIK